jgi:hypothetical protein
MSSRMVVVGAQELDLENLGKVEVREIGNTLKLDASTIRCRSRSGMLRDHKAWQKEIN